MNLSPFLRGTRAVCDLACTRAALLAAGLGLAASATAPAVADTNVLLIIGDDIGVEAISTYGEGTDTANTPNLTELADQGVLFRNAYSHPTCSPTRGSILTGKHPFRTGVGYAIVNQTPAEAQLDTNETTIADVARNEGYKTGWFGKFHLNLDEDAPNELGFDRFRGSLKSAPSNYFNWTYVNNGTTSTQTTYATTRNVSDALGFINFNQDDPWFVTVAFNAAHTPLHTPPADLATVDGTSNKDKFNAIIEAMDAEIGRLIDGLGDEADDTVIIFVGDNGTDGRWTTIPFRSNAAKQTVYEGGINVPLIISGTGVASPGREEADLAHVVDLFATIAEIIDGNASSGTDSVNLDNYRTSSNAPRARRRVYSEQFTRGDVTRGGNRNQRMITNGRYKLMEINGVKRFYDRTSDPREWVDILGGDGFLNSDEGTPAQRRAFFNQRRNLNQIRN